MPRSDEQRAAHALYMRDYRKDPEVRARHNACSRRYQKANPDKIKVKKRAQHLRAKFGLTPDQFKMMELAQGGVCATCKRPPTKSVLNIDHDHETGKVRGLLCDRCNTFIGYLERAPELVETWLAYIDLFSTDTPIYA